MRTNHNRTLSQNSIHSKSSSTNSSLKRRSGIPLKKDRKNVVVVVRSNSEDHLSGTIKFQPRSSQIPKIKSTRSRSDNNQLLSWEVRPLTNKSPRISSPSPRRSLSLARGDTISSRMRSSPNLLNRSCSSIASSSKSLVEKSCHCCAEAAPMSMQRRRSVLDKRVRFFIFFLLSKWFERLKLPRDLHFQQNTYILYS